MDHLYELSNRAVMAFDCYCLSLEKGAPTDHTENCPKPYTLTTPFDIELAIQDPKMFLSAPSIVARCSTGFQRIDKYMACINYIRMNIPGCTVFYSVNDALLRHMVAQILPVIVGDTEYQTNPLLYHDYIQLKSVPVRVFITTARQIGKTTTMAIAIAALLCVADGMNLVNVYAVTLTQATNLLHEIKTIYFQLPAKLRPRIVQKQNECTLSVLSESNGQPCLVVASPGNVEGIRGHKPRIIVVDEYQFTLPAFWTQHIWALTQVTTRILICASTPGIAGSYMAAETCKMKNYPGLHPESQVLDFSLVCKRHREEDTPLLCRCKLEYIPPWKNVSGIRQAKDQFGDGKQGDFIQEVLGEPVSAGSKIFDMKKVSLAFNATPVMMDGTAQGHALYVAIDPSGGGESEMAICSMIYTRESQILVVGLDTALTKMLGTVEITAFVRLHLRKLRQISAFRTMVLVPIVEDQGGITVAATILDVFKEAEFHSAAFLLGHTVTGLHSRGVPTTKPIKENMVFLVTALLDEMRLKIFSYAVTTGSRNVQSPVGKLAFKDILNILQKQMCELFYDDKRHITGKMGPGYKDDLVMAFMLAVYWSNKLRTQDIRLVTGHLQF